MAKKQHSFSASRGFVPTKSGDGGSVLKRPSPRWARNAQDILCGQSLRGSPSWTEFEKNLVETADPSDRAHEVYIRESDQQGGVLLAGREMLIPAEELPCVDGAKPGCQRRYPRSQMFGPADREVSVDSMFDAMADAAWRLERQGVPLGWGRCTKQMNSVPLSVEVFASMLPRDDARAIVQQRTYVRVTKAEAEVHRQATAWLDRHADQH